METKPGWKTTEFWLSVAAALIGAILASGLAEDSPVMKIAGVAAMVLSALGYGVSRGMAKGAKLLLVALLLGAVTGCSKGYIRADAIDGLIEKVAERHDRFVKGEATAEDKDPANREAYLRSSMLLRTVVSEAKSR